MIDQNQNNPLGPLAGAAKLAQPALGDSIKQPAIRNPIRSSIESATDPDTDGRRTYSPGYGDSFANRMALGSAKANPLSGLIQPPENNDQPPAENPLQKVVFPASTAATSIAKKPSGNPLAENQFNHMANNNLRSFEDKGGGIVRQVGANGKVEFTNVGTSDITDPTNPLPMANSINMNASNASMARANAIRQEMINAQAPSVGTQQIAQAPVQSQTDRENAEKTARWKMDELLSMAKGGALSSSQTQLVNSLISAQTQQRGQDLSHQNAIMQNQLGYSGQNVTMRGQDMAAQTAANHLAGNPLDNALKSSQVASAKALSGLQSNYLAETDPAKQAAIAEQISLVTGRGRPETSGRLTLAQQRGNAEIDAARDAVAALTPEEIRRKTAKTTNTGRENPDFDPTLERAVALAGRRKVGADEHFDQRQQALQPAGNDGDAMARFKADKSMEGHTLGKQTEQGVEVLDASGKLIGHYR